MGLFLKKNHLLRCWDWLSFLNYIGALTKSLLLKLSPTKLGPWFVLSVFFFPEVAPCPICHLDVLDRPQIQLCGTVGPSRAAFLEPLSHHPHVASISILLVLVWWIFKWISWTGSTSSFLWEILSFFYYLAWFLCDQSLMF